MLPKYSYHNYQDKFLIVHIDAAMWESNLELEENLVICNAIADDIGINLPCQFWDKDGYLITITKEKEN